MKTQLDFDLAGKTDHPKIHFRESKEVEEIMEDLSDLPFQSFIELWGVI